jgi:predicted aminopeptidase
MRSLIFLVWVLQGCYVTQQAVHQNALFNTREPVQELLADQTTPEILRAKLEHIARVMEFATQVGLNTHGAYQYYIHTEEPVVSYLVQAAEVAKLKSVTWWFPVVGSVPYRGYFTKEDRDAKAEELRNEGYDVYTPSVGAFSSLGWFDDPLFSSMLRRNLADLTDLILHELVHRTLWVPGSVKFNENLAEYVATYLTPIFLKEKSLDSLIEPYQLKRSDRKLFKAWLKKLRNSLEELYDRPPAGGIQATLKAKGELFARFQKAPEKPNFKTYDYVKGRVWNNASVLGASLYSPDTKRFEKAHRCIGMGEINHFLSELERAAEETDDGFKALDKMCAKVSPASD